MGIFAQSWQKAEYRTKQMAMQGERRKKKCSHLLVLTRCHSRTNISTLSYRGSFANLLL